jgi:hypothetical protein
MAMSRTNTHGSGRTEGAANMEHTKKISDEEVAIKRWENEGGEIPTTAESPMTTGAATERRENEGGESQHTDAALLIHRSNCGGL